MAQARGDYDDALRWYRQALEINEGLGNRAGMASTISQIGVLFTERGEPASAVQHNLRSLALRAALGVPEVRIDLHWLRRQRELLGTERFEVIVRKHASDDDVRTVLRLLDERDASAP